jgi:transcription initiation factor TFIID subunit 2
MPSVIQHEQHGMFGTLGLNNVLGTTPWNHKSSRGTTKHQSLLSQQLRIGHQRVNIDVDLLKKKITGFTEITVIPFTNSLRAVKLDCREMKIKDVYINGNHHINYIYKDKLYINNDEYFEESIEFKSINVFDLYSKDITIHQHHIIRQKLNYLFGEVNYDPRDSPTECITNTEELVIILPTNLKLELTNLSTLNTPSSVAPNTVTPIHLTAKNTSNDVYTPIQIKIEYETTNPQNGVNFITDSKLDKKSWLAYTTNSDYNISTSSWVPCIDNLWERNSWSLEVNVPRTVKDIANPRIIGTKEATEGGKKPKSGEDETKDDDDDDDDDDEELRDIVVCSGDFNNVKETPHPIDLSKKVVSWAIFNPVCAQHVGWAVGCFQSIELQSSNEEAEIEDGEYKEADELEKVSYSTPVTIYCLPDQVELAESTCAFASKAIDLFLKEFGSFLFSSFVVVFVQGALAKSYNFAGIAVLSDSLLYSPDLIEPMFSTTEVLLESIATQWSGINIVPQTFNDMWCIIGICRFMSFQFLRTLMGSNDYRFKMKKMVDEVVEQDINKKPIAAQYFRFPISENDLSFLRLKSPLVLYILDRRMTKTDKSFGLARVLPKIFLQAMSGELPNGTLSTLHFQYVCEKINRNKLENFFKQWVYGSGVPIFNISQKFSKKKMAIEMNIRQVQLQKTKSVRPNVENFMNDSISHLDNEVTYPVQPVFTGPMTIRVHEQDGTPYEHIVDLKNGNTRIDIQYNSKFRRKKKEENMDPPTVFSALGDVLMDPEEIKDWGFKTWVRTEEDIVNDAFEWLRVDADFEWIAKFVIEQPDYMYGSQLQYDRDVEAQYEAVKYFGNNEKPTALDCTVLTRAIMDDKYYYGIRIGAAQSLARFSNTSNNFLGIGYLIRIFKELFCFPDSNIPKSNDFNDFGNFFLQKLIPRILSKVRNEDGEVPPVIKNLVFNLLKFNDNSNNDFQDCFYVSELLESITTCSIKEGSTVAKDPLDRLNQVNQLQADSKQFASNLQTEINRLLKLDEWVPSYQNIISVCCIRQKVKLAAHGLIEVSFEDLMYFTLNKYADDIRVEAFKGLFVLGALKNKSILLYFLRTILLDNPSNAFKSKLIAAFIESICVAAIDGTPSSLDDPEFQTYEKLRDSNTKIGTSTLTNMVIIEDSAVNEMDAKRDVFARATLNGAIELLRRDYAIGKGLKVVFWELMHSSLLSIYDRRNLFMICQILFKEIDRFIVRIPIPSVPINELKKKIIARNLGDGKVVLKREGRFKIQITSKKIHTPHPTTSRSRDNRISKADQPAEPKLKLNLTSRTFEIEKRRTAMKTTKPVPKPISKPPSVSFLVTVDPEVKSKVTFKIRKLFLETMPQFSPKIIRTGRNACIIDSTKVTFNFRGVYKSRYRDVLKPKVVANVSTPVLPHRYVKILTKEKKVFISTVPFEDSKEQITPKVEEVSELETTRNEPLAENSREQNTDTVLLSPDEGSKPESNKHNTREKDNKVENTREETKSSNSSNPTRSSRHKSVNRKKEPSKQSTSEIKQEDNSTESSGKPIEKQHKGVRERSTLKLKSKSESDANVNKRSRSPDHSEAGSPFSKSGSPFSPSSSQPRKKKKSIYIHSAPSSRQPSKSPSPETESFEPQSTASKPKPKPTKKPKLKLKLNIKKQ